MSAAVPFIPENSPFTSEQRAWLNGLLAGLFSSAGVAQPAEAKVSLRIAVLYASQSGTAEGLARKLSKELKAQGHSASVSTLVGYTPAALATEQYALIIASTYGDGEAPDGVHPFYEQLCLEHFPRMEKLSYAVLALGDKHYEHFCKFGNDLDAKLAALGANRLCNRIDCDVDVDEPFAHWKEKVIARLIEIGSGRQHTHKEPVPDVVVLKDAEEKKSDAGATAIRYSREQPLLAAIVEKRTLTHAASTKTTLHLAFSIEGTDLKYEAGDACGVIPKNDPNLVAEILQHLQFNGNEQVVCGNAGTTTLHDALSRHVQITRLNRKVVTEYAKRSQSAQLFHLLAPERQSDLERYIYDRGLVDLLMEYPGVIDDAADLVSMLPRLTPRLYSISSSPVAHKGQIHATVAVVRFHAHNRDRGGVCSTLFADRAFVSDQLPIYIQPNKKFKLPKNPDAPMIMIGPGTGVAPFRGFLHERRALGHKGPNWLFFGERSAATDFLYRDELQAMHSDGFLSRFDTAFSRDQEEKVYVQDKMLEQAPQFWDWLQNGASVYVCGDASRMAKDVHATMREIAVQQGRLSVEAADDYLDSLKKDDRYHRDVY